MKTKGMINGVFCVILNRYKKVENTCIVFPSVKLMIKSWLKWHHLSWVSVHTVPRNARSLILNYVKNQKDLNLWRLSNKNFLKVRWSLTPTLKSAVHSKDWPIPYTEAGLQNLQDHCDSGPALLGRLLIAEHRPQSCRIHHWVYSHQVCNMIHQKLD